VEIISAYFVRPEPKEPELPELDEPLDPAVMPEEPLPLLPVAPEPEFGVLLEEPERPLLPTDCDPLPLVLEPLDPRPEVERPVRFVLMEFRWWPGNTLLELSDDAPLRELPELPLDWDPVPVVLDPLDPTPESARPVPVDGAGLAAACPNPAELPDEPLTELPEPPED